MNLRDAVDKLGVHVPRSNQIMCPTGHDSASPSFMLYFDTDSYYCFGCGRNGDVYGFISLWTGTPISAVLRQYKEQGYGPALATKGKNPQQVREHVEMTRILETQPVYDAIRADPSLEIWQRDLLIDAFDEAFDDWWSGLDTEPPVKQEAALRKLPALREEWMERWHVRSQ